MDLTKYRIPVRIEDDGLKDTIVIINFTTDYNLQKLESVVKKYLDAIPDTSYKKIETRKVDTEIKDSPDNNSNYFYTNGQYKVVIKSEQLAFNCVGDYTGWRNYSQFIYGCLSEVRGLIKGESVKIRYISAYPELSLLTFLDGTILYPNLNNAIIEQIHTIKCKLLSKERMSYGIGVINLYDSISLHNVRQSIVDVEILSTDFSALDDNFNAIINYIEQGHDYEKKLFYSLLSKEFVESKNPTYE